MPIAPAKSILSIALAFWDRVPVPAKAVVIVRPVVDVMALLSVTPVTVILGMVMALPLIDWGLVSKVYTPVPAAKALALLLVRPPLKVMAELPELFHVPPALMVTNPVYIFNPVADEWVRVPVMLVVPVTVMALAPTSNVPELIVRALPTVRAPLNDLVLAPDIVRLE